MKIFIISHDKWGYDFNLRHVVVAKTEKEVISLAILFSADEGKEVWETADIEILGDYTGKETEPFILLSDFNAG